MNQLDAHYVGRVADMISDTSQGCVRGDRINIRQFRESIPHLAHRIVHEVFEEDIQPSAITGPVCCGECD
ncbi:MAG: hypothetical protein ACO3LT_07565 [Ilumatobacteraceae bacterium]